MGNVATCFCLFMDKVDCENKQRLYEFWELWMQIKASAAFIDIAFVWWYYFTAKDCRLYFDLYKYVYRLYICNFFCLNKTITLTKRMQTIFKATLFNLRVLHRSFHFNTPSNFQSRPITTKVAFWPHTPSFQCSIRPTFMSTLFIHLLQVSQCHWIKCNSFYIYFNTHYLNLPLPSGWSPIQS